MSVTSGMDNQSVVYPYGGILFGRNEDGGANPRWSTESPVLSERSQSQKAPRSRIPYPHEASRAGGREDCGEEGGAKAYGASFSPEKEALKCTVVGDGRT